MQEYLVLDPDDLLPTSVPVCVYDDFDEAVEHAANRKGYVVLRTDLGDYVVWVSPKFNSWLMIQTCVRVHRPDRHEHLNQRRKDIMTLVRAHRMSEVA